MWDRWEGPDGPVETVAVLTVPANDLVKPLHDRMPAIVSEGQFGAWLDPKEHRPAKLLPLLAPYPVERMESWPVSDRVNAATTDEPELLAPCRGAAETDLDATDAVRRRLRFRHDSRHRHDHAEPRRRGSAFLDVFRWLTPLVRAEDGCIEYQATVDVPTTLAVQDGPRDDVVTVVEKWESVEALVRAHDGPAHGRVPREGEGLRVGVS